MVWNNRYVSAIGLVVCCVAIVSCTISYKFNGASIDYTKVKTISIADIPNQAPLVYNPLSQTFTEQLKDVYIRQTRLKSVPQGGDLSIEGEITGYDLSPQAVKEDAYASQTRLKITIRIRFANSTNPDEDFEKVYSAFRDFSNEKMINDVQDELIKEIVEEIADLIYNDTVAKW